VEGTLANPKMLRAMYFFHAFRAPSAGFGVFFTAFIVCNVSAADFHPPAGERYVVTSRSGTILPGGRILRPLGTQLDTGPGPWGLAVSHNGTVVTADTGPERSGITVIDPPAKGSWRERHVWARTPRSKAPEIADPEWQGVAVGVAFDDSGKGVWVSEGESGRIREIDENSGNTRKTISLNGPGWQASTSGELAADSTRHMLYAVDRTNSRIAVVGLKAGRVESSVKLDHEPFSFALSPDGVQGYVAAADSVCMVDLHDPAKPGLPECVPADSPRNIVATADRVFVSSDESDSVLVLSAQPFRVVTQIPLRIPSLEQLRGIHPAGMAFDPVTKWLLVTESGINAVGIIDTEKNLLIGHLPVGWMPTRVALVGDRVYVTNALGRGTGPNLRRPLLELGEVPTLSHGSVSTFIMPDASELTAHTGAVFANNGFVPWMADPPKPPAEIGHVVLIVKEGRTFDEVLGDIASAGNSRVLSFARLARFGMHGIAIGGKNQFSVQDAPVTPNHHAMAQKWAFSDDFYADGLLNPESLWRHLEASHVSFSVFDDKDLVSDQKRADRFIAALEEPLPQFVYVRLRNDQLPDAPPDAEHPYAASWMEDNDLAVGRILDALSHSRWWPETAVFVTESNTDGGLDHIDSHRSILLAASPYVKRNDVSHTNSNFPGLLRTVFELLHLPPMDLADATAASLGGMFTDQPDLSPFQAIAPDARIFNPAK
jgi:DNA-binding beta-propeller fold protein YncE